MAYVFADVPIGSRTWKVGGNAGTQAFGTAICPNTGTLISTVNVENIGGYDWSSSTSGNSTVFELEGASMNSGDTPSRSDCYFGLSNRVRSVTITTSTGATAFPSLPIANNRLTINVGPIDNDLTAPTTNPDYPTSPRLFRAFVSGTSPNNDDQTKEVNITDGTSSIYACGFGIHLEARCETNLGGATPAWKVIVTPSESVV